MRRTLSMIVSHELRDLTELNMHFQLLQLSCLNLKILL